MARVHRSMEEITGLTWPKACLLLVCAVLLVQVSMMAVAHLSSPRVASGTTDWKGDPVKAHYQDWRP